MGKKDDKVGNKTRYRKEGKRRIKIDLQANKQTNKQQQQTKSKFSLMGMYQKLTDEA